MKAIKKYFLPFCLVLAGCCVALLLAEGFVRIFYPHSRDHRSGVIEIDDYLGWKLQARKNSTHHSRYFDVVYSINALGYRDKPRNLLKDRNIYRILLYGDSQVFGWGVPEDQRFSNLMEDQNQSLEIWNLAVPGYGVDQATLSYEKHGQFFNADEVIFFVSNKILERAHQGRIFRKDKPKFVIDRRGTLRMVPIPQGNHVWTSFLFRVASPLYLPYFVERQLAMLQGKPEQSNTRLNQYTTNDAIGELEKKILERVRNIAFERKHRITIMAFLPNTARKALQNFCDQRGIDFIEIVFDDEYRDLIFGEHDIHWNTRAHNLTAGQLLSQWKPRVQ